MIVALMLKYPAMVRRKQIILQQDNAPVHSARISREILNETDFELMPHPPYSPDLASSDYHLFISMAQYLHGRKFSNIEEVEIGVQEFFASKPKE